MTDVHKARMWLVCLAIAWPAAAWAEDDPDLSDRLEVRSADGAYRLGVTGRVFLDAGAFYPDRADLEDHSQVDSARLGLRGTVARDVDFLVQYELASLLRNDDVPAELRDAWAAYTGLQSWTLRLGQFQEPFSLEELTSARYTTFMERGLPNAFVPGYHAGVAVAYHGQGWNVTGGYFGERWGNDDHDPGWGYAGRVTAAPVREEGRLLHLGASLAYREPDEETLRLRARPETGLTDERLVSTGTLTRVDRYLMEGLEAAWVQGPFSVQAEYVWSQVERSGGRPDADFQSGYVFASWFLTGESRAYSPRRGVFTRVVPRGRYGAVEVALRRSMIDLDDGAVEGGVERNWTLGANWYLTGNLRLMVNAIWVSSERRGVEDDPRILQARLQYDF